MASPQKRGFRLPWGGDARRAAAEPPAAGPSDAVATATPLVDRLHPTHEALGRGPFDLPTREAEAAPEPVAPPAAVAAPAADVKATDPEPPATATEAQPQPSGLVGDDDEPTVDAFPIHRPDADAEAASPVAEADPEPSVQSDADADAPADAAPAWPVADRRSAAAPKAAARPAAPPANPVRHDNALVLGLVKAMRDAAKTARDEAVAALRTDAAARAEAIRGRATVTAGTLRKGADADVAGIREWSKAEMVRVREETEQRITARRAQLVSDAEAEAAATQALLGHVRGAVESFEAEMTAFFDALLAEDDPARLAGLAERMPVPPVLDDIALAGDQPVRARRKPAAATGPKVASTRPRAKSSAPRTGSSRPRPSTRATTAPKTTTPVADDEVVDLIARLDLDNPVETFEVDERLDPEAAEAAEAEALAGLDMTATTEREWVAPADVPPPPEGQTRVIVSGLVSVGGIAAFKNGLVRVDGVNGVNVTSGADGEFVFSVTHAGSTDLRTALPNLDGFDARITADEGAILQVVAHEPAA